MTKKQHKEIARMWAAAIIIECGMDSFDSDIQFEDMEGILSEIQNIANNIIRNRPYINTLPDIIKYATTK